MDFLLQGKIRARSTWRAFVGEAEEPIGRDME